ncbi:MAG: Maf family protein [Victivallaceae bacterium]|nr:Maf family protein [Victivallaceae bacterium]
MLILASQSPRRKELLARLGIPFQVEISDADEKTSGGDPLAVPEQNALLKARAVADKRPADVVIGADTAIVFGNRLVGKPGSLEEAAAMLAAFSGKTHLVATGVAVVSPGKCVSYTETAEVKFKRLDREIIARYLEKVPVLDKAGAYAIQSHGDELVENYRGEFETIVGLPLTRLARLLENIPETEKI